MRRRFSDNANGSKLTRNRIIFLIVVLAVFILIAYLWRSEDGGRGIMRILRLLARFV